jgi:hypothetical protein
MASTGRVFCSKGRMWPPSSILKVLVENTIATTWTLSQPASPVSRRARKMLNDQLERLHVAGLR